MGSEAFWAVYMGIYGGGAGSSLETSFKINTKGGKGDSVAKAGRADVSKGGDDDDIQKGGGIG